MEVHSIYNLLLSIIMHPHWPPLACDSRPFSPWPSGAPPGNESLKTS